MSPDVDSAIENKANECLLNRKKRLSGVLDSFFKEPFVPKRLYGIKEEFKFDELKLNDYMNKLNDYKLKLCAWQNPI